jgi:hypothetical protein
MIQMWQNISSYRPTNREVADIRALVFIIPNLLDEIEEITEHHIYYKLLNENRIKSKMKLWQIRRALQIYKSETCPKSNT